MSKILNQIKKYWKILTIILALLLFISGSLVYITLIPFQNDKPEQVIKDEYNLGTKFSGTGTNIPNNFVNRYDKVQYKIVLSKFDIFKPVYSLVSANVYKGEPENKFYYVQTINLERQGWNNWKVMDYRNNEVRDLSFQDTVNLASRHDLTTSFPGKENYKITNYPPLAQSERETNRQNREQSEIRKSQRNLAFETDETKIRESFESGISLTEFLKLVSPYFNSLKSGYDLYLSEQKKNEQEYQKDKSAETLNKRIVVTVLGQSFSNKSTSTDREINELKLKVENYQEVVPKLQACTKLIAKECELE